MLDLVGCYHAARTAGSNHTVPRVSRQLKIWGLLTMIFMSAVIVEAKPLVLRDGMVVRASGGETFIIESGKRRLLPDGDTVKALLAYKRVKLLTIPDEQMTTIERGENYPMRQIRSVFPLRGDSAKEVHIPNGWNFLTTFRTPDREPRFERWLREHPVQVQLIRNISTERVERVIFVAVPTMWGPYHVLLEPDSTEPANAIPDRLAERTLVRRPSGDVFAIEFNKLRKLPDLETVDALLVYNRANNIQTEVFLLSDERISSYEVGKDFPMRRLLSVFVSHANPATGPKKVQIPEGWKVLSTFNVPINSSRDVTDEKFIPNAVTQRPETILFEPKTAKSGGNYYVLLEPRVDSDSLIESVPIQPLPELGREN